MSIIVKFENKREKAEALPTPIDMYTSTLYATANHINEKGNNLLEIMEQATTNAGLDFKKFAWIPEEPYSPIDDVIHMRYVWLAPEGSEYHILGKARIIDCESHNMEVTLWRMIPHESVYCFDFEKCEWKLHLNLAEQEKIQCLIEKDRDSADILMEIRDYKEKFTEKDIAFYRKQYQKMIELYSKVSEFMMPVYDSDTETLFIDIFDPNRHGFTVTWNENEYRLEQYLIMDDLVQDDDINCFLLPQYVKPLRQVIWSGTNTDKLAAFLEKMGNRVAITDVYTCPISIETYVEFKKLDMSDLVVHGNNELTDLEKTNLKQLKNGIRKMLKSINQN